MQLFIKRFLDYFFAIIASIFAIPVVLITMLIIHINSPESPAIFKQIRVGYKKKEFIMYKLRTMTNEKDEEGNLLPDEVRLKSWGKIIRKLSIDELTQLFNILKGEMSFIGPRPLLPDEMFVMTPEEQEERQNVMPGITGWEAVNEDRSDSRRAMALIDLEYVRNWSLGFDFKICIITILILLGANRASDELRAPKLDKKEFMPQEEVDN